MEASAEPSAGGDSGEAAFDGSGDLDVGGSEATEAATVADGAEEASDGGPVDSDGGDGGVGDASDGTAEAATSTSCGDGIRDPAAEECDDGTGSTPPDSCSAVCRVTDLLPLPGAALDGAVFPASRYLGEGRHPASAGDSGFAIAFVEPDESLAVVALTAFDPKGTPSGSAIDFGSGSIPVLASNPVLAALPNGTYAAAWTDFDGDGDQLGVALRTVDPAASKLGPLGHVNTNTAFSQYDPDVVWTGSELVIAWVDGSSSSTGPDLKLRLFASTLAPLGSETILAATPDAESKVALSAFEGSWAAVWRADSFGGESIVARADGATWTIGPMNPGPADDCPAIAVLDASHLLVVFTEGTDPADSGVANVPKLRAAVLNVAVAGSATAFSIEASEASRWALGQSHPNLVRVNSRIYVTWRTEAAPGDPLGEELWLKELDWSGTDLDLSRPEVALPRAPEHRFGDQRHPALAASPLPPQGAIVSAWDDLGHVFGPTEGAGDIVVELMPSPIVRLPDDGGATP